MCAAYVLAQDVAKKKIKFFTGEEKKKGL